MLHLHFFPYQEHTLISAHPSQSILERLRLYTLPPDHQPISKNSIHPFLFNGNVGEKGFSISRIVERGNNYLPRIDGAIEPTSQGCIIQLRFQLFWGTKIILVASFLLSSFLVVTFRLAQEQNTAAILTALFWMAYYLVTFFNFNREVEKSKAVLAEILN